MRNTKAHGDELAVSAPPARARDSDEVVARCVVGSVAVGGRRRGWDRQRQQGAGVCRHSAIAASSSFPVLGLLAQQAALHPLREEHLAPLPGVALRRRARGVPRPCRVVHAVAVGEEVREGLRPQCRPKHVDGRTARGGNVQREPPCECLLDARTLGLACMLPDAGDGRLTARAGLRRPICSRVLLGLPRLGALHELADRRRRRSVGEQGLDGLRDRAEGCAEGWDVSVVVVGAGEGRLRGRLPGSPLAWTACALVLTSVAATGCRACVAAAQAAAAAAACLGAGKCLAGPV